MTQEEFHYEVERLTELEFEDRIALMPNIAHRLTQLSFLVDLTWSVMHFPASPLNDNRQDRIIVVCRRSGIDPTLPIRICQLGIESLGAKN